VDYDLQYKKQTISCKLFLQKFATCSEGLTAEHLPPRLPTRVGAAGAENADILEQKGFVCDLCGLSGKKKGGICAE